MPIILSCTLLCVSTRFYYGTFAINTRIVSSYLQFQVRTIMPIFLLLGVSADAKLMSKQFFCELHFAMPTTLLSRAISSQYYFSTQSPAICPSQSAIHMCPAHCCPASSEPSSFLTKSTRIGNVQPNFLPLQSYVTPSPYAPVLAHLTVHTVGPSIVAWGDKSLHTYSKPRNKHHQLQGLLRFKKPIINHKLYIVS